MASPVNDTYSKSAAAMPIYGGRFAPPTGNTVASLTLTSASTQSNVPFTVGHTFKQGDLPSGQTLAAVGASIQVVVKKTWSDGSARLAFISALVSSLTAATPVALALTSTTASATTPLTTTDLKATSIVATFGSTSFGSASWSTTDWDTPYEQTASGSLMSAWRYSKPMGSDTTLRAWIEVRLYSTGEVQMLPWLENGGLLVSSPTSKSDTFTFTVGGTQRYSGAIVVCAKTKSPLINGTILDYWLGTDRSISAIHDTGYLQTTNMIPPYGATTPSGSASVTGLPSSYAPFQQGNFPSSLGSVGGNAYVGLLPEWDVVYLTCPQQSTFEGAIRNAYSAGRYPIYYRDETDGYRWPRVSQHTTLDYLSIPALGGTAAPAWSGDHQPNVGYLAYLMTGWSYHLDTVLASCSFDSFFGISASNRSNGSGITTQSQFSGDVRRAAWCWRNLMLALSLAPDSTYQTEYLTQASNNIDWYWTRYVGAGGPTSPTGNTQGWVQPYTSYSQNWNGPAASGATTTSIPVQSGYIGYSNVANGQFVGATLNVTGIGSSTITAYVAATNTFTVSPALPSAPTVGTSVSVDDGLWWHAAWMHDYFTATVGWSLDLGLPLATTQQNRLVDFFAWKAQSIIGRLGFTGSTEFLYRDFAPYIVPIAPFAYGPTGYTLKWSNNTGPWYSDWGALYNACYGGTAINNGLEPGPYASRGSKVEGALRDDSLSDASGVCVEILPAIAYAVKQGVAGAQDAYQRLTTAANYYALAAQLDASPVWSVVPRAFPSWRRGQAVNEFRQIPGTAMQSVPPTNTAHTTTGGSAVSGPASKIDIWCGLSNDIRTSDVWAAANGGHGDYYGNEVMRCIIWADSPAWYEWKVGSTGNVINFTGTPPAGDASLARYNDGLPASAHSYFGNQTLMRQNRAIRVGGSYAPAGTGYTDVEAFPTNTAQGAGSWDAQYTFGAFTGTPGGSSAIAMGCCKDPTTEKIYVITTPHNRVFSPNAYGAGPGGSWANFGSYGGGGSGSSPLNTGAEGPTAVDTRRGRLMWTRGNDPTQGHCWTVDLTSGVWTDQGAYTGAAASALTALGTSCGMVYCPNTDKYYLKAGNLAGDDVYIIDASTFAVTKLTSTGGTGIPAVNFLVSYDENVYNRWLYDPALRGIVYFPRYNTNGWFLRLF